MMIFRAAWHLSYNPNHFHFLSQHVGVLAFLHSQSSVYSGISPNDSETPFNRFNPIVYFPAAQKFIDCTRSWLRDHDLLDSNE